MLVSRAGNVAGMKPHLYSSHHSPGWAGTKKEFFTLLLQKTIQSLTHARWTAVI